MLHGNSEIQWGWEILCRSPTNWAIPLRRNRVLLKLLMAFEKVSWVMLSLIASFRAFIIRTRDLDCSWKLLQFTKRTWKCIEVLSKSNLAQSKFSLCSFSLRPWICLQWRFHKGEEVLPASAQLWSKKLQCLVGIRKYFLQTRKVQPSSWTFPEGHHHQLEEPSALFVFRHESRSR